MTLLQNVTGPEAEALLALTQARHEGWHPLIVTRHEAPGRRAVWGKIVAVLAWLAVASDGEQAVLLDADAVLRRPIPAEALPFGADLGMVLAGNNGYCWLNSGVMFLRKDGDRLQRFFERVWTVGPQPLRPGCPEGGDQGAIQVAMAEHGEGIRLALLPSIYNAYTWAPADDPVIAAFHGMTSAEKLARMQAIS